MLTRRERDDQMQATLALLQQQLRAQADEIGKLQGTVNALQAEKRELASRVGRPPKEQLVDSLVRTFSASQALRLESVEEKVHCNTYRSHTDARFRLFGAPGRFRGSFPDITHAKVEVATPESFGQAVKAQLEFKPLQPLTTTALRLAVDVGDLLSISGAPTLVVTPNPPFLVNGNTQWNPQLEMSGMTAQGTQWEARYSVNTDRAVLGSLEGEVRKSHEVYGDFTVSRWMHEDDIEAWNRHDRRHRQGGRRDGDDSGGGGSGGGGGVNPFGDGNSDTSTPNRRNGNENGNNGNNRGGRRNVFSRRSLWGRRQSPRVRSDWSPRSSGHNSPEGSVGSHRGSPRSPEEGRARFAVGGMGGDRGGWNPLKGPPVPRWLASWRKDFNSCEVVFKAGDAAAVANGDPSRGGGPSGSGMSINGGVINTEPGWVSSATWEGQVSARRRLQHNLDGFVAARFAARELEVGMSYHFTEEFKGWHVNAKAVLSPQGIATPEFTLHHVWDF